eukprot:124631-Ditylum_brightwellii.AAC.1
MVNDCSTCVEAHVSTLEVAGGMNTIGHLKFPKNFHSTLIKNEASDIIDSALLFALSDQHVCNQS